MTANLCPQKWWRYTLEQAIMVFQDQKVDLQEIKQWAKAEKHLDKFKEFTKALTKIKN